MSAALVVFAKAPVPGFSKTRLQPALGALRTAALSERLLADAARRAASADFAYVELCVTPDYSHPAFRTLSTRHGLKLELQGGSDLGARMSRAFARLLCIWCHG